MCTNKLRIIYFELILLLCISMTIPTIAKGQDLSGYWNFNYTLSDSSGNDNNGVVTGNTAWNSGIAGKAFDFNGSTSIDCGWDSSLSIADDISIELWFYPQQWVSGYAAQPISKWTSTNDANGEFISNVIPSGSVPVLNNGSNSTSFTATGATGFNVRANITLFSDGPVIY